MKLHGGQPGVGLKFGQINKQLCGGTIACSDMCILGPKHHKLFCHYGMRYQKSTHHGIVVIKKLGPRVLFVGISERFLNVTNVRVGVTGSGPIDTLAR